MPSKALLQNGSGKCVKNEKQKAPSFVSNLPWRSEVTASEDLHLISREFLQALRFLPLRVDGDIESSAVKRVSELFSCVNVW